MKKRRSCLFWFLGVIVPVFSILFAWAWKPCHLDVSDVNACIEDPECIAVTSGICSRPVSINQADQKLWDLHQKLVHIPPSRVMCAPNLPLDYFQPECLQNACQLVPKEGYAVLEFPEPPQPGRPVELLFRLKTSSVNEHYTARISFIPNLVTLNSGDLTWEGVLEPGQEKAMRVLVTFSRPGYYQVQGETFSSAGRQQTDVNLLLTADGVRYGEHPKNEWEMGSGGVFSVPAGERDGRVWREFLFDPPPALGAETTVLYRVRSSIDLGSADLQIVLPPGGFELLDATYPAGGEHGETASETTLIDQQGRETHFNMPQQFWWRGPVRAGETLEIRATVRVLSSGWGLTYGEIRSTSLPADVIYAFLYVDEYNGFYEIRETP